MVPRLHNFYLNHAILKRQYFKLTPGLSYIVKDVPCFLYARIQINLSDIEVAFKYKKIDLKKGDELEFIGRKMFPVQMKEFRAAHFFSLKMEEKEYSGEFYPILYQNNFEKYLAKKAIHFLSRV